MASTELTGATKEELASIEGQYYHSPMWEKHKIPFDTAFCLREIARQPDDYDGPQRYCKRRATRKDDYEGDRNDLEAFALFCHTHGGDLEKVGHEQKDTLAQPETAALTHGLHAEDEHLIMDFDEDEQALYDRIMEDWPEIYDWPARDEDPARYRILRRIAVNEVRSKRGEAYLDSEGEVYEEPVFDEQGIEVGHKDTDNPISREYRLLMSEITDQMRELGLTPKEQQKMDTLESEQSANEAVSQIASDAIDSDEEEYDPTQFRDG